jgi:hypothetical protein
VVVAVIACVDVCHLYECVHVRACKSMPVCVHVHICMFG